MQSNFAGETASREIIRKRAIPVELVQRAIGGDRETRHRIVEFVAEPRDAPRRVRAEMPRSRTGMNRASRTLGQRIAAVVHDAVPTEVGDVQLRPADEHTMGM